MTVFQAGGYGGAWPRRRRTAKAEWSVRGGGEDCECERRRWR